MPRFFGISLGVLTVLVLLLWLVIWTVLAAPFFRDFRVSLIEEFLTEQLGQALVIDGDVSVAFGPVSRLHVSAASIPSENIEGTNLAELTLLELDVDLVAMLGGVVGLDNLDLDGLKVNLHTLADGTTSWSDEDAWRPQQKTGQGETDAQGLLAFLKDKTAIVANLRLDVQNEVTGFVFDFALNALELQQLEDGQLIALSGAGTVNGEGFQIEGTYPRGRPFTTDVSFGPISVAFDGTPTPEDQGGGFTATLEVETGSMGEVLDVLLLERSLEGEGALSASVTQVGTTMKVTDIDGALAFDGGRSVKVSGAIDDVLDLSGVDIAMDLQLFEPGKQPKTAERLKDLKLTGIQTRVVGGKGALEFQDLLFDTNAFERDFKQVGPVSIGRVFRTEEGKLSLKDVYIQAGPRDAPYIVAEGEMEDLLDLKGLELEGDLSVPASVLLQGFGKKTQEAFGKVHAEFALTDAPGHLSLTRLVAETADTDLWSFDARMELKDVTDLEGIFVDIDLGISDATSFLTQLGLDPVDLDAAAFEITLERDVETIAARLGITADSSAVVADLNTDVEDRKATVRGSVDSDRLSFVDIKHAISAGNQLASLVQGTGDGSGKTGSADKPEEALVTKPEEQLVTKVEEPLVTGGAKDGDDGGEEDKKVTELLDPVGVFAEMDLDIGINLKEITGQKGVSSVASELVVKDGKVDLGPLEMTYGGGYFRVGASMDVLKAPHLLRVSGATTGWQLHDVLDMAGVKMDARGKLRGDFNLTGNRASLKTYLRSMYGSATISMGQGAIASSLLELAGLGVFPWLFSKELGQGYTTITCIVAPLRIDGGKVATSSAVIETRTVQMVMRGQVDWRRNQLALRAEPRPVGRPLARSAWPFDVTGSLTNPNFNLRAGGTRVRVPRGTKVQMSANRKPCKPDVAQIRPAAKGK